MILIKISAVKIYLVPKFFDQKVLWSENWTTVSLTNVVWTDMTRIADILPILSSQG